MTPLTGSGPRSAVASRLTICLECSAPAGYLTLQGGSPERPALGRHALHDPEIPDLLPGRIHRLLGHPVAAAAGLALAGRELLLLRDVERRPGPAHLPHHRLRLPDCPGDGRERDLVDAPWTH